MSINSQEFSDKTFWFLRGIDDEVKRPKPAVLGAFKKEVLRNEKAKINEPFSSCIYMGRDFNIVLIQGISNSFFIFDAIGNNLTAEFSFKNTEICSLCRLRNDLLLLDAKNSRIIRIHLNDLRIEDFSNDLETEQVDLLESNFDCYVLPKSVNYQSHGLVAWPDEFKEGTFHALIWKKHSNIILLCKASQDKTTLIDTNFGITNHLFHELQISSMIIDNGSIFFTDSNAGRIFQIDTDTKPLKGKVIVDSLNKKVKLDKNELRNIPAPNGLCAFRLSYSNLPSGVIRKLFSSDASTVLNNSFLIVIDTQLQVALTLTKEGHLPKFLPLIGEVGQAVKMTLANLMHQTIEGSTNVTLGPLGTVIFWSPHSKDYYLLNPRVGEQIKPVKQTVYRTATMES